jgi:hypothetical protein
VRKVTLHDGDAEVWARLTPDGRTLLCAFWPLDRLTLILGDAETGKLHTPGLSLPSGFDVRTLTLSPNGKLVALGGALEEEGLVQLRDVKEGKEVRTASGWPRGCTTAPS